MNTPGQESKNSYHNRQVSRVHSPSSFHISEATKDFVAQRIYHYHQPTWSTAWIAQTTLHNVGNVISTLSVLLENIQPLLNLRQLHSFSSVLTHLIQTLRIGQQFLASPHILKERFSLSDCLHSVLRLLQPEFKQQGVTLHVHMPQHQPTLLVYGHYAICQQILMNILKNSLDSFHRNPPSVREIHIRLEKQEVNIALSIQDTGTSTESSVRSLEHLIHPGFSTKPYGLGLGLSYVQWHMRRVFRGSLQLTQVPNLGFQVLLHFPHPPEIATIASCENHGPTYGNSASNGDIPHSW